MQEAETVAFCPETLPAPSAGPITRRSVRSGPGSYRIEGSDSASVPPSAATTSLSTSCLLDCHSHEALFAGSEQRDGEVVGDRRIRGGKPLLSNRQSALRCHPPRIAPGRAEPSLDEKVGQRRALGQIGSIDGDGWDRLVTE